MADIILKLPESQVDINYILCLLRMVVHMTSITPPISLKFRYQAGILTSHVYVSIQTLILLFICYDSELFRVFCFCLFVCLFVCLLLLFSVFFPFLFRFVLGFFFGGVALLVLSFGLCFFFIWFCLSLFYFLIF